MPTLTSADGTTIAYETIGTGPALILAMIHLMALTPSWKKLKAVAPTLPYDLRILGDTGRGVPLDATR